MTMIKNWITAGGGVVALILDTGGGGVGGYSLLLGGNCVERFVECVTIIL